LQSVANHWRTGAGVSDIPVDKGNGKGIVVCLTPPAPVPQKSLQLRDCSLLSANHHPAIEWAQPLKGKSSDTRKLAEKDKEQFAGPKSRERASISSSLARSYSGSKRRQESGNRELRR
jgi:hypothetical protein